LATQVLFEETKQWGHSNEGKEGLLNSTTPNDHDKATPSSTS
jgi:hypothetical protein